MKTEKKLYLLQVAENGISGKTYEKLEENEKGLLEERNEKYYLKKRNLKVVLTGGAFDILHAGHIYTLEKAKEYGDMLIAVVALSETMQKLKNRKPIHSERYRAFMISSLKPVDLAIIGSADFKETIEKVKPNVIVFGYDQEPFEVEGVKIVKIEESLNPKEFKTSRIIRELGL
ncbi:adenylyltransferase/cytidyltransferase family protein [Candidatus Micrarchaeota archaeon]|nr:adenylyltransferase/cytidyltransferase family protein [Candidatus Micrarchaeota archaeon]